MKGVSELLAAVLLIVVTVAIATIIFSFFTSTTISTTERVGNKSSEAVDCTAAGISIDTVWVRNGTQGRANVNVRNTGFSTVTITSAQLYNKTGDSFTANGVPYGGFSKGQAVNFVFDNISVANCPSDFYSVVVTTSCGGSDTYDGTPKCV